MTKDEAIEWLVAAIDALIALKDTAHKSELTVAIRAVQRGGAGPDHLARAFAAEAQGLRDDAATRPEWSREVYERDARVLGFCAAVLRATVEEERGPDLAAENARLRARVAELEAGLRDVVGEFRDALPYVPSYFREKWGYDGAIEKAGALVAGTRENGEESARLHKNSSPVYAGMCKGCGVLVERGKGKEHVCRRGGGA
jgi:hypothetical protein